MQKRIIDALKVMHWLGLTMLLAAVGIYFLSDWAQQISGMVTVASLAGVGMVMMSPFPIALFLDWARSQSTDK
ncbi:MULTISPECIES: hypothetical protein [Shewanella]|uniref:Uncharacterized protein n=1 Tax=Shewanella fidelis TaxID=173509 RepID=A0AAW8NU10_9GAMM|nr:MULTISPECIES: hypothetical protein [Shewanella]MDR8525048.1 hypothetical protein [Shewanella fidelis]MDW4811119.1 hypothetical protein [Shewanella fidelis]MDW4815102.1 hypothetical protein [Shewanella fidelis]MDW4819192.1 hypothetical protein [Shewanella fidelis]MDW4823130.1 hypothetical protein [Shewanella fidelis]